MKTKNVKIVTLMDFNNFVMETYKRPYNFQQQDGCKDRQTVYFSVPDQACDYENDTIPEKVNGNEMGVSFKAWLERNPNQPLENSNNLNREINLNFFWKRNFYPEFQTLVNDLHAKGLIEAGEYGIEIDW